MENAPLVGYPRLANDPERTLLEGLELIRPKTKMIKVGKQSLTAQVDLPVDFVGDDFLWAIWDICLDRQFDAGFLKPLAEAKELMEGPKFQDIRDALKGSRNLTLALLHFRLGKGDREKTIELLKAAVRSPAEKPLIKQALLDLAVMAMTDPRVPMPERREKAWSLIQTAKQRASDENLLTAFRELEWKIFGHSPPLYVYPQICSVCWHYACAGPMVFCNHLFGWNNVSHFA